MQLVSIHFSTASFTFFDTPIRYVSQIEKVQKRATTLVINLKITLRRKVTTTEATYFEI